MSEKKFQESVDKVKKQGKNVIRIELEKAIDQARRHADRRCDSLKNYDKSQVCSNETFRGSKKLKSKINEIYNK